MLSKIQYSDFLRDWIGISHRVGSKLPHSLLVLSIQRLADIDILTRSMEDECCQRGLNFECGFSLNNLVFFSESWVIQSYEIFRAIREKGVLPNSESLKQFEHDLRLIRIPIAKFEIARDSGIDSLEFEKFPPKGDESDFHTYRASDKKKSMVLPMQVSQNGSIMWYAYDSREKNHVPINRRDLSDRIYHFLENV